MNEAETLTLTVTEFIQRISKELNILGSKGIYGNELELIALVRNCQFLYDKNLPDFKNIQKKNEAWKAIASVFDVSVGEVQQRWKTMRDSFNKCRNRTGQSEFDARPSLCPFYEDLKFLEPYIIGRRVRSKGLSKSLSEHLTVEEETTHMFHQTDLTTFIERIKSFPILYHQKYMSSLYRKQKVEAWLQISKYFGIPVKECFARWKNLRERYSKERRQLKDKIIDRKWELYDHLSFLNEHVRPRRKTIRMPAGSTQPSLCYVVTSSPNSGGSTLTIDSSQFLNEVSGSAKKEVTIEDVEFFDISSDITSSPAPLFNEDNNLSEDANSNSQVDSSQSNKNSPDEDDLFGQSIAAELRLISCPKKKMKLKADIYRLLYENSCE